MNLDILDEDFQERLALDGTVIRLPLRRAGSKSEISSKSLTSQEIRQLLLAFIRDELGTALLFLSHLESITVLEIDDDGVHEMGEAEIDRRTISTPGSAPRQDAVSVSVTSSEGRRQKTSWRIFHSKFTLSECVQVLSDPRRLGRDASEDLEHEKLIPDISLAFPTPLDSGASSGHLFTYLPLPLPTGFPCHIHSLFALAPSRQNLRNAATSGFVRGARDE